MLVLLAKLLFNSLNSNLFLTRISTLLFLLCCSLVWSKGLEHYCTMLLLRWPLYLGETLPTWISEPKSAFSSRFPTTQHPESTRVMSLHKFYSTHDLLWMHLHIPNFNGSRVTRHLLPSRLIVSTPRLLRGLHTLSPQGLQVQENHLTQMTSNSLCPREWLCSGDGVCPQGWESQDTDRQRYRFLSSPLALWDMQSVSPSLGIWFRCNWEKG